jgi:hypothetical protein
MRWGFGRRVNEWMGKWGVKKYKIIFLTLWDCFCRLKGNRVKVIFLCPSLNMAGKVTRDRLFYGQRGLRRRRIG